MNPSAALVALAKSPDEWAANLSAPPEISTSCNDWRSAILRQWTNTSAEMDQPSLNHHYIVQHLGGPKQVNRCQDGPALSKVVDCNSLTFVPVGSRFKWRTEGPIQFAHLYISPTLLNAACNRFGRGNAPQLLDQIGARDPLLEVIFAAMRAEAATPDLMDKIFMDSLLETFLMRLLAGYSTARIQAPRSREILPRFQLARVLEYIDAHLQSPITLDELAATVSCSVFHFSRAFRNATGEPPYRFVLGRRVARAASLLSITTLSIDEISTRCGFNNTRQLSRSFLKLMGQSPSMFRRR